MTLTRRTHWIVRVTHWINVIALPLMVASGLRIFNAYPAFARKGETFCCYPFEHKPIPAVLTFGGWLAGARHWHFAVMWILVANALVYLGFIYLHGEWRELAPRRGDAHRAWEMIEFYTFRLTKHPHQGKHNALQKTAYFAMPIIAAIIVLSGTAIWKPVQFQELTATFGGYDAARYVHFFCVAAIVLFRPRRASDPDRAGAQSAAADDHRPRREGAMTPTHKTDRRGFLKAGLSLGALSLLTGCDLTDNEAAHWMIVVIR